jgi:hypothetical protein
LRGLKSESDVDVAWDLFIELSIAYPGNYAEELMKQPKLVARKLRQMAESEV